MWYPLRNYFDDRLVRTLTIGQVAVLLGLLIGAMVFAQPQETPTILHYSVDFGVDLVGPWYYLYRIPFLGAILFLCNSVLGYLLFYADRRYTYLLLGASSTVVALLIVVLTIIVLLNS